MLMVINFACKTSRLLFKSIAMESTSDIINTKRQIALMLQSLSQAEKRANLLNEQVATIRAQIKTLTQQVRNTSNSDLDVPENNPLKRSSFDEHDLESSSKRVKYQFKEENGYIVVYTDGACENNGKKGAKAGIGVWFGDGHPDNISKPVVGKATNNTAEIQACIEALKKLQSLELDKVLINTDSEFTINCMTKWITNWKKKNWKLAGGGPVKNREDLEVLDNLCQSMDVKWNHVRGHRGIHGNEEADKLARNGALSYVSH